MNDMGGKSVNDKDSREIDDIIKRLRESVGEGRPKPHGRGYSSGSFEQKLAELLEKHLNEKKDSGELREDRAEYAADDLEIVKEGNISSELLEQATKPDFERGGNRAEADGGADATSGEPQREPENVVASVETPALTDTRPAAADDLLEPEPWEDLAGQEMMPAIFPDKPDEDIVGTSGPKAGEPECDDQPAGGGCDLREDNDNEALSAGGYEPCVAQPGQGDEDVVLSAGEFGDADAGEPEVTGDGGAGFEFSVPVSGAQPRLQSDALADEPADPDTSGKQESDAKTASQSEKDKLQISEDEMNVMLALGYEKELGSRIGQDKLNDIKQNLKNHKAKTEQKPAGDQPVGTEYTSHGQDAGIKQDCRRRVLEAGFRLAGTVFIALLLGLLENLGFFGVHIPGIPSPSSPVYFSLLAGALLACATAMSYSSLAGGLCGIYRFYPEPHSLSALAVVLAVVHNLAIIIIRPEQAQLYNFPAALCLVMSALSELLDTLREKKTFEVISSDERRYGLQRAKSAGEKIPVYNVRCSKFTSGYVRRTNTKKKGIYLLNYTLVPALVVGGVMAIITEASTADAAATLTALVATVFICLPVPVLLLALPPAYAVARLKKQGCALVGLLGVEEYSKEKLIVFEDSAMFPVQCIRTKGIKLYDGFEIYDVLMKVGSLFCVIGGPLGEIFEGGSERYRRLSDVKLIRVERGGVEAQVGGLQMICGNYDFVEKYGIYPKRNPRDEQLLAAGEVSIIYIAIDRRAAARLYIDYRVDPIFEEAARRLAACNCRVAIRTCDPGIDEAMLERKRSEAACRVEIIRTAPGGREPEETVDSGIVALGSPYKLAAPLCAVAKLSKVRRRTLAMSLGVFILNILLTALLAVTGLVTYAVSGFVGLYMLLWTLPVCLMTYRALGDG